MRTKVMKYVAAGKGIEKHEEVHQNIGIEGDPWRVQCTVCVCHEIEGPGL